MALPHFYYHPRVLRYDFGPQHPLRPERLRRTIDLLGCYGVETIDPGEGSVSDVLRVHDDDYVEAVRSTVDGYGIGGLDNPRFDGMFEASLAYVAATVKAAEAVRDGARLSFAISGGLHHALRDRASGFCVFNDTAIACHVLLERFERVAYIDIDVHHGDGVQWIFYDEPRVLTCSIHEEGKTLFPRTGGVEETGVEFTSLNIPLQAKTTGDVWLDAFRAVVPEAIERFEPNAIVLQMGTDPHYLDPLGHIRCTQQEWLGAVSTVKGLGIPIVAVGGGGYNLTTVPRMWVSACLTLGDVEFCDVVPSEFAEAWGVPTYADAGQPLPRESGREFAENTVARLKTQHLPNIPRR